MEKQALRSVLLSKNLYCQTTGLPFVFPTQSPDTTMRKQNQHAED